jgi:hypothetical protein
VRRSSFQLSERKERDASGETKDAACPRDPETGMRKVLATRRLRCALVRRPRRCVRRCAVWSLPGFRGRWARMSAMRCWRRLCIKLLARRTVPQLLATRLQRRVRMRCVAGLHPNRDATTPVRHDRPVGCASRDRARQIQFHQRKHRTQKPSLWRAAVRTLCPASRSSRWRDQSKAADHRVAFGAVQPSRQRLRRQPQG